MQKTILIATERKTGKDVILVGTEEGYNAQRDRYREFTSVVNEEFSHVGLYSLIPVKKPFKFVTREQADARATAAAPQTETPPPAKAVGTGKKGKADSKK